MPSTATVIRCASLSTVMATLACAEEQAAKTRPARATTRERILLLASRPDNQTDPSPACIMHNGRLCFQWLGSGIVNAPNGAKKAGARPKPALEQPFCSNRGVGRAVPAAGEIHHEDEDIDAAYAPRLVGWAKARLRRAHHLRSVRRGNGGHAPPDASRPPALPTLRAVLGRVGKGALAPCPPSSLR